MPDILGTIKRNIKGLIGKDVNVRENISCSIERFGSSYGGWDIVPGKLHADSVVYSFGIGEDISFELALVAKFGLEVHSFDPTPKALDWVRRQALPPRLTVHDFGLAHFDGDLRFNPPKDPAHVSFSVINRSESGNNAVILPVKKLDTILKSLKHSTIDILKMDIEGAEYQVIEDIARTSIRPRQVLIEFHHRFPQIGVKSTRNSIKILGKIGYSLFSVSGDEYGFIYKD